MRAEVREVQHEVEVEQEKSTEPEDKQEAIPPVA
jgi:hypothetical protein